MAYMFSPSEPATTSVAPWRLPTARDALTPLWGKGSVPGFDSCTNH